MIETHDGAIVQTRRRFTSRQIKLFVGGLIVAVAAGYMVFSAASGSTAYYVTVDQVQQQGPSTRNVRVSGDIVGDSVVWVPRDLRLTFDMVDDSGTLSVVYQGARPDMFRDGAEVVVEGKLTPEGVFEARTMLLKCPSKYEEAE